MPLDCKMKKFPGMQQMALLRELILMDRQLRFRWLQHSQLRLPQLGPLVMVPVLQIDLQWLVVTLCQGTVVKHVCDSSVSDGIDKYMHLFEYML
jgi:hypothetical protein